MSDFQSLGVEVLPHSPGLAGLKKRGRDFYDVALISRPHVAADFVAPVRSTFPEATVIYDTVDLHHLRYSRKRDAVGLGPLDVARGIDVDELRRSEIECFRQSDIVAAVTEAEADVIRELAPATPTVVLPTVHPIPEKHHRPTMIVQTSSSLAVFSTIRTWMPQSTWAGGSFLLWPRTLMHGSSSWAQIPLRRYESSITPDRGAGPLAPSTASSCTAESSSLRCGTGPE